MKNKFLLILFVVIAIIFIIKGFDLINTSYNKADKIYEEYIAQQVESNDYAEIPENTQNNMIKSYTAIYIVIGALLVLFAIEIFILCMIVLLKM